VTFFSGRELVWKEPWEASKRTMSSGAFNKAVSLYAQLTADSRLKVWDVASGSSKQE
jgi:hypothetical protein